MDWNNIYEELSKEKFRNTLISGPATIGKVKQINEQNRKLFIEYHKKRILGINENNLVLFKYNRSIVLDFLTNSQINRIYLKEVTQDCLKSYFTKYYYKEPKDKFEKRVEIIRDFFICNKISLNSNILNDLNNLVEIKFTSKVEVPGWSGYYPSLDSATSQQKEFYSFWLECFKNNNFIDINGVLAYPFVYLYHLVEGFIEDKDIEKLETEFGKLDIAYGQYNSIKSYIESCTADAHCWLGHYDKYWSIVSQSRISFEDALNIKPKCRNTSISGEEFLLIIGNKNSLTALGKDNLETIKQLAEIFLKDFEIQNGSNIIEYFVNHFDYWNLSEEDFAELKKYIMYNDNRVYKGRNYKTKEEWFEILKRVHLKRSIQIKNDISKYEELIKNPNKHAPLKKSDYSSVDSYNKYIEGIVQYAKKKLHSLVYGEKYLFNGIPISKPTIEFKRIPQIISEALQGKLQEILRECENTFREESGIPKIGEGWVNETLLYYKLREAFPKEKIIHHGIPIWLGKQHLDIFFEDRNVAIEYQGEQHSKPVGYFGGIKSFQDQQQRYLKKHNLCEKNGCKLIYVYPDYNFNELIETIEQYL